MDLTTITPTSALRKSYPVADWVNEISVSGFVVIPIYHSKREQNDEYKAMTVRDRLAEQLSRLYFMYGHDENGRLVIVCSDKVKPFKDAELPYEQHTVKE